MKDFTLIAYTELIMALKKAGYSFYTFEDWCNSKAIGKYVILRHDIDNKPLNAMMIAKLEAELGVCSTYYFRTAKKILQTNLIKEIATLGHEIGYHYRDFVEARGNQEKAIELFKNNLQKLRLVASVRTISMDGCPLSKYDNRDLWKVNNYRDYGIVGEPYFDLLNSKVIASNNIQYFTDTARMWDGDKYNVRDKIIFNFHDNVIKSEIVHSTPDFIKMLNETTFQNNIMITTHPQRWTDNKVEWLMELIVQSLKNKIKQWLISYR